MHQFKNPPCHRPRPPLPLVRLQFPVRSRCLESSWRHPIPPRKSLMYQSFKGSKCRARHAPFSPPSSPQFRHLEQYIEMPQSSLPVIDCNPPAELEPKKKRRKKGHHPAFSPDQGTGEIFPQHECVESGIAKGWWTLSPFLFGNAAPPPKFPNLPQFPDANKNLRVPCPASRCQTPSSRALPCAAALECFFILLSFSHRSNVIIQDFF